MSKITNDFPTQDELAAMSYDELRKLWMELISECDFNEGTIACRAFDIGWYSVKRVRELHELSR